MPPLADVLIAPDSLWQRMTSRGSRGTYSIGYVLLYILVRTLSMQLCDYGAERTLFIGSLAPTSSPSPAWQGEELSQARCLTAAEQIGSS